MQAMHMLDVVKTTVAMIANADMSFAICSVGCFSGVQV